MPHRSQHRPHYELHQAREHVMHPFSDEESMGETLTTGRTEATLPQNALPWRGHRMHIQPPR